MRRRTARRGRAVAPLCLAALLAGAPAALGAAPAGAAETAYRYWSFWTWDEAAGSWEYASLGPGSLRPGDGDLLGFRFGISAESAGTEPPRGSASFGEICGASDGGERVAFVLDFGTAADAPAGETPPRERTACAPLDGGASAAEALAEVAAPLRYDAGALLCAIAGYPAEGCGDPVSAGEGATDAAGGAGEAGESGEAAPEAGGRNPEADEAHEADEAEEDGGGGGSLAGIAGGLAAVLLLAAAALVRARRRRR
ncbi:SCO2322 family protein [Streptomyces hoynatensis]|uniref:LPXTG cell wall anchor domain-containing protein n=1 Tax=Streptomyces hoynatensis TaxID=1141874 RepID=A0A3A9ZC07_9ACTN|nr:SCO2322 family protein [Streptomyces hoynatensis]RKN45851.1 hypothetical protein D7294_05265 [Streptomyces hoynatensis]